MAAINKSLVTTAFPLQYVRQFAGALDRDSVFYNLGDATTYATSSPRAYVGQIISVVNETENSTQLYVIANTAGELQEVGSGTSVAMIFVDTITALKTLGEPPTGVPDDLAIGQQAFVSEDQKIHFLTSIGTDGDPTTYNWEVQASDAPTWNDTNALVNFYVTDRTGYTSIGTKDQNTLYFLSDEQIVYKGTTDYTNSIIVVSGGAFPEVTSAIPNKLYIDSDSFEVRITADKAAWINVSPGYITDGSNWAQTTDDSKLATVGAIKAGIGASFIAKIGTGEANVIITATADGGIQRTSAKIGGATLAGTTDANTLATEAAVETAIEAGTANKVDKVTGTVGNAMEFGADGAIVDSGMAFGGATLGASPNATTLATEAAVEDAISWKELTSE